MATSKIAEIFNEIKVVELSSVLAGPLVGSFFAELGAEVLKVENKKAGGDVTRTWHLKSEDKSQLSAYYQSANYGKTSLFLDLTDDEDRKRLYEEIKTADIVLNNNNLKSAEKLGTSPRHLRKLKPDLIYAQLDGFDDEDADRVAYDIALQAESGFLSMTGLPHEDSDSASANKLAKMPVAFIDVLAAHQLKEAILVALLKKLKTGEGTYLRASLYGVALTSQKNQATNYLLAEHIPAPMGTLHPNIAPYGEILTFKDGIKIVLAVGSDKQFKNLFNLLGIQNELLTAFASNADRLKKRSELEEILQSAALNLNFNLIKDKLKSLNIPYGQIKKINEVWDEKGAVKYIAVNAGTPRHSAISYFSLKDI